MLEIRRQLRPAKEREEWTVPARERRGVLVVWIPGGGNVRGREKLREVGVCCACARRGESEGRARSVNGRDGGSRWWCIIGCGWCRGRGSGGGGKGRVRVFLQDVGERR